MTMQSKLPMLSQTRAPDIDEYLSVRRLKISSSYRVLEQRMAELAKKGVRAFRVRKPDLLRNGNGRGIQELQKLIEICSDCLPIFRFDIDVADAGFAGQG